jgi:hypothetical protein
VPPAEAGEDANSPGGFVEDGDTAIPKAVHEMMDGIDDGVA